jgi:hypothetical protein
VQSIELAVAAEELGLDGAYFRVHHFARQLASPFPLLAAIGARTSRIEIGTGVIDMRYENPLYMAEDAAAATSSAAAGCSSASAAARPSPRSRRGGVRLRAARRADRRRRRTRAHGDVPDRDRRRGRRALGPGDDRLRRAAADPAAVAGAGRPDLVGLGHARDGGSGRPNRA